MVPSWPASVGECSRGPTVEQVRVGGRAITSLATRNRGTEGCRLGVKVGRLDVPVDDPLLMRMPKHLAIWLAMSRTSET